MVLFPFDSSCKCLFIKVGDEISESAAILFMVLSVSVYALLEYIASYADSFSDVGIEMHRAKAKLALRDNDYDEAMKEAQLAYEESCKIDNQLYELECLGEKILVFKECGVNDNELLEDNQRMQMLMEVSSGDINSRYYLSK